MSALENRNIKSYEKLVTPEALSNSIPTTNAAAALVRKTREEIRRIICGDSSRMLLVVGPLFHPQYEGSDGLWARLKKAG